MMMLLLPLPLVQLLALLVNDVRGYSGTTPLSATATGGRRGQQQRTTTLTTSSAAAGPKNAAAFASTRSSAARSSSSTILNAGLRDLVGPYDDEYGGFNDGGVPPPPYIAPSVRDERNSVFDRSREGRGPPRVGSNFGSGGFGSGGNGGPPISRRNSPGFVGFRGPTDPNYPDYDVVIDTPIRGGGGLGTRNIRNGGGGRIFDDFNDPPGSSTRRIGNFGPYNDRGGGGRSSPYDRGSDFVNTNGSRRNTRSINNGPLRGGGLRRINNFDNDFDDDFVRQQRGGGSFGRSFGRGGGGFGGGRSDLPQIYRRDYLDTLDGRSFSQLTPVERYFEAWNRRNIPLALSCFDDEVYYDDTQFSEAFEGKARFADHLLYVADCLPDSFYFVVDEISVGRTAGGSRRRDREATPSLLGLGGRSRTPPRRDDAPTISIGCLSHIENEFGTLPFARCCSFFKIDPRTNLIVEAYDFPEAAWKLGSTNLRLLSVASKLSREPKRWFPFIAWIGYVYVVYFSNGILPGKDLFHSDPKAWSEVQDLTFNFMFIAPAAHLPTAAKINPILEGLFNGLLAWAFMFAGFLSDERSGMGPYGNDSRFYDRMVRNQEQVLDNGIILVPPVSITKKNLIGLVPTIVWMQFFTVAFLLPYLFARTSERYSSEIQLIERDRRSQPRRIRPLYKEELDRPALVLGEWKGLGILLGAIGIFALYWGFAGRPEDFGPPIWVSDKRMVEFMKLLDKDRVAASFVLNLWVFGIFQGWLVDDDWKRRGRSLEEEKFLRNVAKFVPFFGLASYLVFRPKFPSSKDGFDYDGFFRGNRRGEDRERFQDDDDRGGFFRDRFRGDDERGGFF